MKRFILFIVIVVLNGYVIQASDTNKSDKNLENSDVAIKFGLILWYFEDDKDKARLRIRGYSPKRPPYVADFKKTDTVEEICESHKNKIEELIPDRYKDEWKDLKEKYNLSDFINVYYGDDLLLHEMTLDNIEKSKTYFSLAVIIGLNRDDHVSDDKKEARKAFQDFFRKCFFKSTEESLSDFEHNLTYFIMGPYNPWKSTMDSRQERLTVFAKNIRDFLAFTHTLEEDAKIYKSKIDHIWMQAYNTLLDILVDYLELYHDRKSPFLFQGDKIFDYHYQDDCGKKILQEIFNFSPLIGTFDANNKLMTSIMNKLPLLKVKKSCFFENLLKVLMYSLYDKGNSIQCFRLWNAASDSKIVSEHFSGEIFFPYIMDHPPEKGIHCYAVLIQLLSRGLNEKDNDDNPMPNADYFSRVWGKWEETKGSLDEALEKNIIQKLISDDRVTEEILQSILDYFYGEKNFNLFIRLLTKLSESNALSATLQQNFMKKMIEDPMPSPSYVPIMTFLYDRLDLKSFIAFWNDLNTKKIITDTEDDAIEKLLENKAA